MAYPPYGFWPMATSALTLGGGIGRPIPWPMTPSSSGQIDIAPGVSLPGSAVNFRFARSGGPGGQNVNKLNTKAVLSVELDDLAEALPPAAIERLRRMAGHWLVNEAIVIASDEHRSQIANRNACLERLRELIVKARARPRKRKPTRPTKGSVERRIEAKKQRGQTKRERRRRFE